MLTDTEKARLSHAMELYDNIRAQVRITIGNDPRREDLVAASIALLYFAIFQEDMTS